MKSGKLVFFTNENNEAVSYMYEVDIILPWEEAKIPPPPPG